MRVGLVTERIGAALGGAERWTYDFARWLQEKGHEVHVVCRQHEQCTSARGVTMHPVPSRRSPLAFAAAAAVRVDALRLDVVHDMGCGWNSHILQPHCGSRTAANRRNLQLLPSTARPIASALQRRLPRYQRFTALCERQYASGDRLIVAVSRMVARDIEQYHGVDPRRIRVIYNGVDVERFSPMRCRKLRKQTRESLGVGDQDVLLLLVAHNLRLKGVSALIRSAAALRRDGAPVKLAVVGNEWAGRWKRNCRRLGIDARFVGAVPDVLPFYAAADVYVHPTYYDPCSLVVLEACACGLPVITTRFNGCSELMYDDFADLILSDPADARGLQLRLERLLDRDVRLRFGRRARAFAERHPAERNFEEILDTYRQLPVGPRWAA